MDYSFNVPINSLSLGQVSIAFLRESYKLGHKPCIFPIGNQVDISAQIEDKDFNLWLQSCINSSLKIHKRNIPCIKIWHLNGGLESISNKQVLYSFYECDSPTPEEINIIQNNHKVIFPCDYNTNAFEEYGCENKVTTVPLGFDSFTFKKLDKKYFTDDRISFGLVGKWEGLRKRTDKVIKSWTKRFGNNPKYFLNVAAHNPFIHPDQIKQIYANSLEGKHYGNIQFLGYMAQNVLYNDFLNSLDIVLALGTESFGLPEFTAIALGKYGVISNYGGHKQWANGDIASLVKPSSKIIAQDGIFFNQGQPFNQGSVYDFDEKDFIQSCEEVIKKVEKNRINEKGLELQEKFTYKDSFGKILKELES